MTQRPYGTVAIDKKVKFNLFEGKARFGQRLAQLHQGIFESETTSGAAQFVDMMNDIKTDRWMEVGFSVSLGMVLVCDLRILEVYIQRQLCNFSVLCPLKARELCRLAV